MPSSTDWWRSAVIYQIYPRSFMDTDGNGVGDLPGIVQKLDYVAALGVDAVWISPFYQSPMKDFGYDVSDYLAVDPLFGTMDDFKDLLMTAHGLGLKVIIDQVWSHTSDQHPWFVESSKSRHNAKADWYVWANPQSDGSVPNNWLSTFGGDAWTWDSQRQQYYLHHFLSEQPALNWYNPEVQTAMLDIGRFWLDLGVDGFRFDVINFLMADPALRDNPLRLKHMPLPDGVFGEVPFFRFINKYNQGQPQSIEMIQRIRALLDCYEGAVSLAEVSCAEDAIADAAAYVNTRQKLHMAYNSSLMTETPLDQHRLIEIIQRVQASFGTGVLCWTAGTHDFPRLASRWTEALMDEHFSQEAFNHMFAALLITLEGSCCIYQGDELGLPQAEIAYEQMQDPFGLQGYPHVLGRDGCRTPMPWEADGIHASFTTSADAWLPVPEDHKELAVDWQERDPNSLLNKYRRLIQWRKRQPALQSGTMQLQPTEAPVLAFTRKTATQTLLCLFNFSSQLVYQTLENLPACHQSDELDFQVRRFEQTVELPGYGVFIGVCEHAEVES